MSTIKLSDDNMVFLAGVSALLGRSAEEIANELLANAKTSMVSLLHGTTSQPSAPQASPTPGSAAQKLKPLPDVAHTVVEGAWVEGLPVSKKSWQHLLADVVAACAKKSGKAAVIAELFLTHQQGDHSAQGQYYVPEADLTLQGASAGRILKQVERLSRVLGMSVRVSVRWYDNPKAAKPGHVEEIVLP